MGKLFGGFIMIAVGLFFIWFALWAYRKNRTFFATAPQYEGNVVDMTAGRPVIRFKNQDGKEITFIPDHFAENVTVGQEITVYYDPDHESTDFNKPIAKSSIRFQASFILTGLGVLMFGIGLFVMFG